MWQVQLYLCITNTVRKCYEIAVRWWIHSHNPNPNRRFFMSTRQIRLCKVISLQLTSLPVPPVAVLNLPQEEWTKQEQRHDQKRLCVNTGNHLYWLRLRSGSGVGYKGMMWFFNKRAIYSSSSSISPHNNNNMAGMHKY